MRFLSTKFHGLLDYIMSVFLMVAPWLLGFAEARGETWIPVILGASMFIYALFTDYELGAMKILPMRAHLLFDFVAGALLAVSPWLFGFAEYVYLPHLILGIAEMGAALVTKTTPYYEQGGVRSGSMADSRT